MQSETGFKNTELTLSKDNGDSFVPGWPIKHILAPTDLSDKSKASIGCALSIARRFGAELTLLHVWQDEEPIGPTLTLLDSRGVLSIIAKRRDAQGRAEQSLRALRDRICVQHAATEYCFLIGEPCDLIVVAAKDFQIDLLVISSHYRNWLHRRIERSESEKIIRDAPCPVLVVPGTALEPLYEGTNNVWLEARGKTTLVPAR